jgi:uncharacterized protein (TIGR00369 family)
MELARSVLAAQPFSALLGAEVVSFGDGVAELRLPIRDELRQQHGLVHGGVLDYLVDNAVTFAAGSVLGADIVTASLAVDYLRPARDGELRARAWVVHRSRSQAVVRCDVACDGDLCVTGSGRVSLRPTSG